MSNLVKLCGTLLAILGLGLSALAILQPGRMDVYGVKLDTAAILFVGGILSLGLGALIDAIHLTAVRPAILTVAEAQAAAVDAAKPMAYGASGFGRRSTDAAVGTAAVATAAVAAGAMVSAAKAPSDPVAETISALEQAKADVIKSIGSMDSATLKSPAPVNAVAPQPQTAVTEPEVEDEADEELFVVEEKVIRGRPSRVLSDDTVEAETDEGWMRFENLEHLNEYLDSVEEQSA